MIDKDLVGIFIVLKVQNFLVFVNIQNEVFEIEVAIKIDYLIVKTVQDVIVAFVRRIAVVVNSLRTSGIRITIGRITAVNAIKANSNEIFIRV